LARTPIPPKRSSTEREDPGKRRAGWQARGGGKSSRREDEEQSDPLLDRSAGRRDRSSVRQRSRRAQMMASLRAGGPLSFLPRSPVARMLLVIVAVILLVLVMASVRAADGFVAVPPYAARVTDTAGMLTAAQRSALEGVLADYESRSGSQIAVLLLPSTAPESIEQYSIRVADAWKLGRKGVDDGVLLLVAKDNPSSLRRMRIDAGRGVQGSLTDAQSKRVLQDVIAPHFRQNDYYGGLAAGVSAIATLIDKEHLPAPPGAAGRKAAQAQPGEQGGAATGASGNAGLGSMAAAAGADAIGGASADTAKSSAADARAGGAAPGDAPTRSTAGAGEARRDSGGGGIGWFFPLVLIVAGFFLMRSVGGGRRSLHRGGWGSGAGGVLLGAALGQALGSASARGGFGGGGGFGGSGGGFGGGGGGTFDGGGASGDW
jgi:uncharacterized protein